MLRRRQICVVAAVLVMAACARSAAERVPEQVHSEVPLSHALWVSDPNAASMIIRDIGPLEGGRFRWTGRAPTVRLNAPTASTVKRLRAHFWIADEAFAQTGPIEIGYFLNGQLLKSVRYETAGEHNFDSPVDTIVLPGANEARMEIDKLYIKDGIARGVALAEFGFDD